MTRLSILDNQLLDPQFPKLLQHNTYSVEAVYHMFAGGAWPTTPRTPAPRLTE